VGIQLIDDVADVVCYQEIGVHVDPAMVIDECIPDHIRFRRSVWHLEVLSRHIWYVFHDVCVIDHDRFAAVVAMPMPRLDIELREFRNAMWILPQGEELAFILNCILKLLLLRRRKRAAMTDVDGMRHCEEDEAQ